MTDTMIQAANLTKVYGTFTAINDVSFNVPQGQVAAFLGPNGAGKTTTMKVLTGFLAATSGTARIAGFDVATDRLAAAARLGYLPENGPLYHDMTPASLLRFFGEVRGMSPERLRERIDAVVHLCNIKDVLGKTIAKLSKGYRQRVGMAQAILHEPDVLIMDEPTSGLDPNQIRDVRRLIRELGRSRTILLSTHILQEVQAVADRVIFIHAGAIVFDGTPKELETRGDGSLDAAFHALTGVLEGAPAPEVKP
jgi:ABC-2 type transport system ATP-binding protein